MKIRHVIGISRLGACRFKGKRVEIEADGVQLLVIFNSPNLVRITRSWGLLCQLRKVDQDLREWGSI